MNLQASTPLAVWLKKMRDLRRLTQEAVAFDARMDPKTLRSYESGKSRPSGEAIKRLVAILCQTEAQAVEGRKLHAADEELPPATEVTEASLAASAPGRFTHRNQHYYKLEKFIFGAVEEQPQVAMDRAWPDAYHAETRCLRLRLQNADEVILPTVEVLAATKRRPLELTFARAGSFYEVPQAVSTRVGGEMRFPRVTHDDDVVRLLSVNPRKNGATLRTQLARYWEFARTNLVYDYRRGQLVKTLRQELDRDGRLHPLSESPLANILGINTLIVDANGNLLIPARSTEVAYRAGQLTPSSSGTLEWGRIDLHHETSNELNIGRAHLLETPSFLGLCRELHRGGLPDLFYFARVNLSVLDVNDRRKLAAEKIEVKRLHYFPFGELAIRAETAAAKQAFRERFQVLLEQLKDKASLPLLINLSLWRNYMLS